MPLWSPLFHKNFVIVRAYVMPREMGCWLLKGPILLLVTS